VELNPVRANLVQTPEQYPWSSYNFHTRAEPISLLDYDRLYLSLGNGIQECRIRYKEFVNEKMEDESVIKIIREQTNKCGIIGKLGPGTTFYPQSYSQKVVPGPNF
jgi:putative transposase